METGARYSCHYDIPVNRLFVEKFKKEYGTLPTAFAGESYDGLTWFTKVIEEIDSMSRERWVDAFEKSIYKESLKGTKIMRECDHQALQVGLWTRSVKTEKYPFYYLEVVKTYPHELLYEPCPKNPKDWPSKRV
jgi:branched-chain amino acid transport system substrate-binding protein